MQCCRINRCVVGQVRPLQPVPQLLDWVQLGRVAGQRHRFQSRRVHKAGGGAVHLPAVPNDNDPATEVPQEIAQEGDDVRGLEVAVLERADEQAQPLSARRQREGGHDRHLLPVPATNGEEGRLAARRERAADQRIQQEAALVEENERGPAAARAF